MSVPILFEDDFLIVCRKRPGLSSEDEMCTLLQAQTGAKQVYCVHRLDKAVSGIMVFAKDGKTAAKLSALLADKEAVTKEYLAVVQDVPAEENGILHDLLFHDAAMNKTYVVQRERRGVKAAELEYTLLQSVQSERGALSLLRIRLHTGRSHQIRVQFASRKLPLAGDAKYGSSIRGCGIALLSHRLSFPHPVTGKCMDLSVLPPEDYPWNLFDALSSGQDAAL